MQYSFIKQSILYAYIELVVWIIQDYTKITRDKSKW